MVRSALTGFSVGLQNLLHNPIKVIWICLSIVLLNVVLDGSLLRLWSLHRDHKSMLIEIEKLQLSNQDLRTRVKHAGDPAFLEREARDRFDLVSAGDLVFIFSEDEVP